MVQSFDVIVVGLGGLGSVVTHALASAGMRVMALDRYPPGHAFGSSHGRTRVIRKAYFEHPDYVPVLKASYRAWDELEAWAEESLFARSGVLEVGPSDGVVVPGVHAAAKRHRLSVEALNRDEIRRRYPMLGTLRDDEVGVMEHDAGYLHVESCVRAWARRAASAGARIACGDPVVAMHRSGSGWEVRCERSSAYAAAVVVCPGAWASRLLPLNLGACFNVLRKPLLWFDAPKSVHRDAGFPVWLFEKSHGVFYGFPGLDGEGFKVAEHSGGTLVDDPAQLDRALHDTDLVAIRTFLTQQFPTIDARCVKSHAVCMYTMSPDGHPVVGRVPGHEGLFVGAGLSGHGFKMVPALGAALAALVVASQATSIPSIFDPQRLLDPQPHA